MKDWSKEFTEEEREELVSRYHRKKKSTKQRHEGNLEFSLTLDDWFMMGHKLLGRGRCDYTNMSFNMKKLENETNPRRPSVERIDDTLGYVPGNVCVVLHRANHLKDLLVDKKTGLTIADSLDKEIVRAMILHMSKDHMEKLKTKYILQEDEEMSVDASVVEETISPVEEQKLPEDVAVALAYAAYSQDLHKAGMEVSVTYAQFKAKYVRNTCAMSGEKISQHEKAVLVMDLQEGFAKDNFVIVSKKIQKAMTDLMIATGLSLPKVYAMLKRIL